MLVPEFYRFLQGQNQATSRKEFSAALGQLTSLLECEEQHDISVKGGAGPSLWREGISLTHTERTTVDNLIMHSLGTGQRVMH